MYHYWLIDYTPESYNAFRIPADNATDAVNYGHWFWKRVLTPSQRERRCAFFVCGGRSEHDDPSALDSTTIDYKCDIKGYYAV